MIGGLSQNEWFMIQGILKKYPEIESVRLFGSRAKGTYKKASDVDIAVKGENITERTINSLWNDFEESDLPYFVDVIHYDKSTNSLLKDLIDKEGIEVSGTVF